MKKIILLIEDISKSGGTERVAATLTNELIHKGHNVTLYSLNSGKPFYEISKHASIVFGSVQSGLSKKIAFLQYVRSGDYDACIVVSMGRLSLEVVFLSKIIKVKSTLILSEHISFESFSSIKRRLKAMSYKCADKVIVLTEYDKSFLEKNYHLKNIHTIANISPFHFKKNFNPFSNREQIALAVGRLTSQKNFERLISIWHIVNKKNWKLVIIGDGPQKEYLKDYAAKLGLSQCVNIIPATKDIENYYSSAKIILMTSRYEGLPMVLIESKNFGLPAIAFDCRTGPSDIINDQIDGFLIDANRDDLFVNKLNFLLSNDSFLNEMSQSAFLNSRNFSPKEIIDKWESVI